MREKNWCRLDTKLDALMAEYDPRSSRSRREHTLDKLRKALPWPEDALQVASGGDGGGDEGRGGGTSDDECFRGEANSGDRTGELQKEGGGERRREDDVSDDDGYYADDFAVDNRRDSSPLEAGRGQGDEQLPSHTGDQNEDSDANAVADRAGASGGRGAVHCQPSGNKCGDGDGDTSSALGEGDARGHATGGGEVDSTGSGVDVAGVSVGAGEVHPGSTPKPRVPPAAGGDDDGEKCAVTLTAKAHDEVGVGEDQGRVGVAVTEGPTKRPATAQRKARWNPSTASGCYQSFLLPTIDGPVEYHTVVVLLEMLSVKRRRAYSPLHEGPFHASEDRAISARNFSKTATTWSLCKILPTASLTLLTMYSTCTGHFVSTLNEPLSPVQCRTSR